MGTILFISDIRVLDDHSIIQALGDTLLAVNGGGDGQSGDQVQNADHNTLHTGVHESATDEGNKMLSKSGPE